jgi:hypothetical protein
MACFHVINASSASPSHSGGLKGTGFSSMAAAKNFSSLRFSSNKKPSVETFDSPSQWGPTSTLVEKSQTPEDEYFHALGFLHQSDLQHQSDSEAYERALNTVHKKSLVGFSIGRGIRSNESKRNTPQAPEWQPGQYQGLLGPKGNGNLNENLYAHLEGQERQYPEPQVPQRQIIRRETSDGMVWGGNAARYYMPKKNATQMTARSNVLHQKHPARVYGDNEMEGVQAAHELDGPSGKPASSSGGSTGVPLADIVNTGMKIYNSVQDQRADASGLDQFQLYGGAYHPTGLPMGMSAQTDQDKAARSRMDYESDLPGIFNGIAGIGGDIAKMIPESGDNRLPFMINDDAGQTPVPNIDDLVVMWGTVFYSQQLVYTFHTFLQFPHENWYVVSMRERCQEFKDKELVNLFAALAMSITPVQPDLSGTERPVVRIREWHEWYNYFKNCIDEMPFTQRILNRANIEAERCRHFSSVLKLATRDLKSIKNSLHVIMIDEDILNDFRTQHFLATMFNEVLSVDESEEPLGPAFSFRYAKRNTPRFCDHYRDNKVHMICDRCKHDIFKKRSSRKFYTHFGDYYDIIVSSQMKHVLPLLFGEISRSDFPRYRYKPEYSSCSEQSTCSETDYESQDDFGDLRHEADSTPDAVIVSEEPINAAGAENTLAIQNTQQPMWDYVARASRRYIYQTLFWTPSTTTLLEFAVAEAVIQNPVIMDILSAYRYVKWSSIKIGIRYETNPFYAGLGRIVYTPSWTTFGIIDPDVVMRILGSAKGMEFFANENTEIEYEIPWSYPMPLLETSLFFQVNEDAKYYQSLFGRILIGVLSPIVPPPTQVAGLRMQITTEVVGLQPSVPDFQSTAFDNMNELRHESDESLTGIFYYPTTNRMQGNYNTTRLAGSYTHRTPGTPETNVADLAATWCLRRTVNWSNTHIGLIPDASFEFHVGTYLREVQSNDNLTMIDFLGTFATNWSGTFEFKVQIARTSFHQGKLLFAWLPSGVAAPTLQNATQFPHTIVDVASANEMVIKIPNTNMRPLRYCSKYDYLYERDSITLGTLHVYAYNQLIAMNSVSNTCQILFWQRGHITSGPDCFKIYNPCNLTTYDRSDNSVPASRLRHENLVTLCEDTANGDIPIGFEEIVDLGQLTSRTQPIILHAETPTGGTASNFQAIGYGGLLNTERTVAATLYPNLYLKLISSMFGFWWGDLDIMVQGNEDVLIVRQMPNPAFPVTGGNMAFGSGPGMIRFQNATTMVTAKLSPYGINNFFLYSPSNNFILGQGGRAVVANHFCTPSSLIVDCYNSKTLVSATEVLVYYSTSPTFGMGGYSALPDPQRFIAEVKGADENAAKLYKAPGILTMNLNPFYAESALRRASEVADYVTHSTELERAVRNLNRAMDDLVVQREEFENQAALEHQGDVEPPPSPSLFQRIKRVPSNLVGMTEDLKGCTENIRGTTEHIKETVGEVRAGTSRASTAFAESAERGNESVHTALNSFDSITTWVDRIMGNDIPNKASVIMLVIDLIECVLLNKAIKWTGFIIKLATFMGLATRLVTNIFELVKNHFNPPNQFPEGNDLRHEAFEDMSSTANIGMVLSMVVMTVGLKETGGLNSIKNKTLWETMAQRGHEIRGIKSGITGMFEAYGVINEAIMEGLQEYVFPDDPAIMEMNSKKKIIKKMESISERLRDLYEHDSFKYITYVPAKRKAFKELYNDMNNVRHKVTCSRDRELSLMFLSMKSNMTDLISAAMDNSPEVQVRIDPNHLYICGDPGLGKSSISTAFAKAILMSQKDTIEGNIYSRTENAQFHDNYNGQLIYQIDDGNMLLDGEIAMEAIQRNSNVPMILQMADLRKKGMYFTSKMIITTSNTMYPTIPGITCNDALLRRRNLLIAATWKPEYLQREIDGVPNVAYRKKEPDFSHMEFALYDPMDWKKAKGALRKHISFKEILEVVVRQHANHLQEQTTFIKGIQPSLELQDVYTFPRDQATTDIIGNYFDVIVRDMRMARDKVAPHLKPPPQYDGYGNLIDPDLEHQGLVEWLFKPSECVTLPLDDVPAQFDWERDLSEEWVDDNHPKMVMDDLTEVQGIGIHKDRVDMYLYCYTREHCFKCYDLNSPLAENLLKYIVDHSNFTEDQIKRQFGRTSGTMRQTKAIFQRVYDRMITGSCNVREYLSSQMEPIYQTAWDFAVVLPLGNYACLFGAEGINMWMRTKMRLAQVQQLQQKIDEHIITFLPPAETVLFLYVRLVASLPFFAKALFYHAMHRYALFIRHYTDQIADMLGMTSEHSKQLLAIYGMALAAIYCFLGFMLVGMGINSIYKKIRDRRKKNARKDKKLNPKTGKPVETANLLHEEDTLRIQTHEHKDLPDDGNQYVHAHACEKCNSVYTHCHKKNSLEWSQQYDHLCHKCMLKRKKKAALDLVAGREPDLPTTEDNVTDDIDDSIEVESISRNETPKTGNKVVRVESVSQNETPKTSAKIVRVESVSQNETPKIKNVVRVESEESYDQALVPKRTTPLTLDEAMKEVNKRIAHSADLQTEGTVDQNALDIAKKVYFNQGRIWNGIRSVCYLGLYGRVISLPIHLLMPVQPIMKLKIERMGIFFEVDIHKKHIHRIDIRPGVEHECAFIDLSDYPSIPSFGDIRSLLLETKDVGVVPGNGVMMQVKTRELEKVQRNSVKCVAVGQTLAKSWFGTSGVAFGFKYFMSTEVGDCGAPIFVLNSRISGKIIGLHCIGSRNKDEGYAFILTRELVDTLELQHQCSSAPPYEMLTSTFDYVADEDLPSYTPPGRHLILGKPKTRTIATPMKSDIIPTPIFDRAFPHTTEPVCLTANDPRNLSGQTPLQTCLQKFDTVSGGWDYVDRCVSREHSLNEFLQSSADWGGPRRVLTMDEAINGIPGWIEPLNMRTSPGYPYIIDRPSGHIGKSGFFIQTGERDSGQPLYKPKPEVEADILDIIKVAKEEGYCKNNYYLDWLKDERRKVERVRQGKTRMFNIHNFAWLIIMRMYFGAVFAMYNYASWRNGSTIGINMHGPDVTAMINYLKTAGKFWWDLDVRNFDGTAPNEDVHDAFYVFKKALRTFVEVGVELDIFGDSMFWRLHICGSLAYSPFTGIPSGHLGTAVIDTEVNKQRRSKAWRFLMRTHKRFDMISLDVKKQLAREVGNGDDLLGCTNESVIDVYNPFNIMQYWKDHGIDATPPTKEEGGLVGGFRDWNQITYLKCHFGRHEVFPSFYVAKMALNTVTELSNWIRISSDNMAMLRSNITDMERFLYPHGENVYNQVTRQVQIAMREIDELYNPTSFHYYDECWRIDHELC